MDKGIELKISNEKSEELFFNALCNIGNYMQGYGLVFTIDRKAYETARNHPAQNGKVQYFEDVIMNALRNGAELKIIDEEGEGEYNSSITLSDIHERVPKTPLRSLMEMIEERDDVSTADVLLQTVFFNKIVFG